MRKIIFLLLFFVACSPNYYEKIIKTENYFYKASFQDALNEIVPLVKDSSAKDRLLYLMEAGIILHTMGEYKKSIKVFEEADYIAETIKTSISKEALSFFLSDRESNFKGENFERVLIKFYIALNYVMLGDYERAKQYFKKLDFDLKWMKYTDDKYKQNLAARYIDAIISEYLGRYNDARAQYKNIAMLDPENKNILGDFYVLALKESDTEDILKYQEGKKYVKAFNLNLEPVEYTPEMGELVIIYEAGKSAIKKSRGRLLNDEEFAVALRAAIEMALIAEGAALSTTAVMAMIGTAENPIPIYVKRDTQLENPIRILINNKFITETLIMNDYSETAIRNFNDNYSQYIAKNVASIATKIVIAAIAADKASKEIEKSTGSNPFARVLLGAVAGKGVAETIKPDLRCWHLLPSNFQISRIFLQPGEYKFNIEFKNNINPLLSNIPFKIKIEPKKITFLNFRSI